MDQDGPLLLGRAGKDKRMGLAGWGKGDLQAQEPAHRCNEFGVWGQKQGVN